MVHLIFMGIRVFCFSALVLFLGNWIHWDGRSLSQHFQQTLHQVENKVQIGSWIGLNHRSSDQILVSEKQKLRNLIRELNRPDRKN